MSNNPQITLSGMLVETIAKLQWHLDQLTALAEDMKDRGFPIAVATWTKTGSPLLMFDQGTLASQIKRLPPKKPD